MSILDESDSADFSLPVDLSFNETDLVRFNEIVSTNKLSHEDAQALIDLAASSSRRGGEGALVLQKQEWEKQRAAWRAEVFDDPEMGGENSLESKQLAMSAVESFGTPELKSVFNCGWGDHPAMVRFCVNIGKALRDADAKRQAEQEVPNV
jgi:hypothetical protein